MEAVKAVSCILLLIGIWLVFLLGIPWIGGFFFCRISAVWHENDKIQKYLEVKSKKTARLFIPRYQGFNDKIRTNIPLLYNKYIVNEHPDRLSMLGLVDYCITSAISVVYCISITGYFFFGKFDNPLIPVCVILFMIHGLVFSVLINWNGSKRKNPQVISKADLKSGRNRQK